MRRVEEGSPGWQPARDRLEEHHRRTRERLRTRDLPLFGLVADRPGAPWLASAETVNDVLMKLGVGYGGPHDSDAPLVEVYTYRAGTDLDAELLIEQAQDAGDIDVPVGSPSPCSLVVDGADVAAKLRVGGPVWVVSAELVDGMSVAVLARGWPLETLCPLELAEILDVEPLLAERQRLIDERSRRSAEPAPVVVDVAHAHRDLLDHCLADSARDTERSAAGRPPRRGRSRGLRQGQLWEAAVQAQLRLTDQDRATADDMVEVLVNELVALDEAGEWFRHDPALREAAIVETLLWTTELTRQVPSAAAHEAWLARRTVHPTMHPTPGRRDRSARQAAEARWRAAWPDWVAARS